MTFTQRGVKDDITGTYIFIGPRVFLDKTKEITTRVKFLTHSGVIGDFIKSVKVVLYSCEWVLW